MAKRRGPLAKAMQREAALFANYLIGERIPADLSERYAEACKTLLPREKNNRVMRFAMRNPWSIGLLDAGCGLVDRDNMLRARLLVMASVLEANTRFTDHFLPSRRGGARGIFLVILSGAKGALKAAAGIPFVLMVKR